METPVYTPAEAVQVRVGRAWRDAWVEEVIDPDFVRVRLATGARQTETLPANSDRLRKWGVDHAPQKPRAKPAWKPRKRKRWSDALVK